MSRSTAEMVFGSLFGCRRALRHRRRHIVEKANATGTAYLRIDRLPAEAQARVDAFDQVLVDLREGMK